MPPMLIAGVDTGGTFTDFVLSDGRTHKVLSTPDDPARAVLQGLRELGGVDHVVHGSTVATNAFLERKGARIAFYTNEGFEDVLEIGRQARGSLYDLRWQRPAPLVPRELRIGVRGRIGADGRVVEPLGPVRRVRADEYAVGFLHSYLNPAHEREVARRLGGATMSSEILPEYREYERFSTTVLNAYVAPVMSRYVGRLEKALGSGLTLMSSAGGTLSARLAAERPVNTLLSGPAGGVAAALSLGIDRLITFDMGGTSTDVALIDGSVRVTKETVLDGYPVRVPMLDIHTIGAGGGSIARIDEGGALRVGPESAGARPGPICYGFGGTQPTVTDANVVLGRITELLGGRMKLDVAAAKRAVSRKFAEGIVEVANSNMDRAIRRVSVERGYDPREFALLAFGGAGPLHACELADRLGMKRVIVPHLPGLFSAFGMLVADAVVERSRSALAGSWRDLERDVRRELPRARLERFVEMRYRGQSYELRVRNEGEFAEAHRRSYGYARDAEIEVVNLVVRGTVPARRLRIAGGEGYATLYLPRGWTAHRGESWTEVTRG